MLSLLSHWYDSQKGIGQSFVCVSVCLDGLEFLVIESVSKEMRGDTLPVVSSCLSDANIKTKQSS